MPGRSRNELMDEIAKIDASINSLLAQMPAPPSARVVPFPWGLWVLTIVFLGAYAFKESAMLAAIHSQLYAYRVFVLVVGLLVGLFAVVQTIRSLAHIGIGGGKYRAMNKRIEALRRERGVLATQLNQMKQS